MKTIALAALFSASATAATINLDLPPGDYMLVPVAPYAVVTLQSVPIDPPEPLDTDSDGIADDADQCPTVAGVAPDGCPVVDPPQASVLLDAIRAAAPAQHATEVTFAKIAGSDVDVFADCADYSYGDTVKCAYSWKAFTAYSGGAWDWDHGRLALMANGGHYDYGGNELYIGQLTSTGGVLGVDWSMPIPPQPLTEGNCGYPIYGPGSDHTYAGPQYIPTRDEFWNMVATVPFPRASHCPLDVYDVTPGKGGWTTDGATWTKVSDASEGLANYPRACYLPTIDRVVVLGATRRYMIDPSDGEYSVTQIPLNIDGYVSSAGAFDTAADGDICYEYIYKKGITGYRYSIDGTADKVFRSQSDIMLVPSLSVDHMGNLVVIGVNGYAKYINVATGEEIDISGPTGIEDGEGKGYIYGKFDLVPGLPCIGVGIADGRRGMFLATLPASVCDMSGGQPVADSQQRESPVINAPSTIVGTTEPFMDQCRQAGVIFCDPLSTHGPYEVRGGVISEVPNDDGSNGIPVTQDWRAWRRVKSYGSGDLVEYDPVLDALKLTKTDSAASSGIFATNFSRDLSKQFGEGDAFAAEWQVRYNCEYVYADCDRTSSTYKTARRPFMNRDGSTQGSKIAIIAEGDLPGVPAGACDVIQVVVNTDFGTLRAFSDCGKYLKMETMTGMAGGSYQFERSTGADYSCLRYPVTDPKTAESWEEDGVGPNCAMLEPEQWLTMRVVMHVGHWGTQDTRFQLFYALEGEPLREVIDQQIMVRAPDGFIGYGKIHLQMHSTGAVTGSGDPDRIAWYRNLIITDLNG